MKDTNAIDMIDISDSSRSSGNVPPVSFICVTLLLCHVILRSAVSALLEERLNVSGSVDSALVPDEQRLYRQLLSPAYARTAAPYQRSSSSSNQVLVNFQLSLQQIVDLDERRQILTTSVCINQDWMDDSLKWNESQFNGIRTLRVRAVNVWQPDTFMLNNADETQSGFLRGIYVNLHSNGSVLWSFPQRLKSSCKVNIAFFPFDDQSCTLRFGSWIYPRRLVEFKGTLNAVELSNYIDNSEWALSALFLLATERNHFGSNFPELVYVLRMRRRSFYYVFNIIVPCLMLSVLTLLTFWLPSTSGEKISLGLSVFLTFSMFMLLIAEEVPATSESVPLIGIYIMTVMTMTSISVIMAVMVINCYHRGQRLHRPPLWVNRLVLRWIASALQMPLDVASTADDIQLDADDEENFRCSIHSKQRHILSRNNSSYQTMIPQSNHRPCNNLTNNFTSTEEDSRAEKTGSGTKPETRQNHHHQPPIDHHEKHGQETLRDSVPCDDIWINGRGGGITAPPHPQLRKLLGRKQLQRQQQQQQQCTRPRRLKMKTSSNLDSKESVWITRESLGCVQSLQDQEFPLTSLRTEHYSDNCCSELPSNPGDNYDCKLTGEIPHLGDYFCANFQPISSSCCNKAVAMAARRRAIAEWQAMAEIIDRLLFWIFLVATFFTYLVILVGIPSMKSDSSDYKFQSKASITKNDSTL